MEAAVLFTSLYSLVHRHRRRHSGQAEASFIERVLDRNSTKSDNVMMVTWVRY